MLRALGPPCQPFSTPCRARSSAQRAGRACSSGKRLLATPKQIPGLDGNSGPKELPGAVPGWASPAALVRLLLLHPVMDVLLTSPALASDGDYQPLAGLSALKSAGGVAYGALVLTYFVTLWQRRAKRASSGQRDRRWTPMKLELPANAKLLAEEQKEEAVTPLASAM